MRIIADKWQDYELIDSGNQEKLEKWGEVILRRPDPQAIWQPDKSIELWNQADAIYHRSSNGGGSWQYRKQIPSQWTINYNNLIFKVSPTNFKHTGLFPEQAANWEWIMQMIKQANRDIKVLNLFAYTGGATMAASSANALEVVHVDAAKGMVQWAKENMHYSHLDDHTIRFIVDDVNKFVQREKRRGHTYDAIIMDPPSYGRGPNGEMWKLEQQLPELITACKEILSENPLFMLVNCYTTGFNATCLENLLITSMKPDYPNCHIEAGEVAIKARTGLILPCGIYGRFTL